MDKLIENLAAIIGAAAKSNLGILALLSVALSVLAYLFFVDASEKIKVGIFSLLFLGVAGFGMAMFGTAPSPASISQQADGKSVAGQASLAEPQLEGRRNDGDSGASVNKQTFPSQHMAIYELIAVRNFEKRVEKAFTRDLGQFKATNSRQYKTATPSNGWMWDLDKPLVVKQGPGEAGRCEGVDMNQSSETGVSVFAHLDQIRNMNYPLGAPGYVNCSLDGTIYRKEPTTEATPPQSGELSWNSDRVIFLPPGTASFTLKVKTYDGRERVFTETASDQLFDVQREPGSIIVSPKVATKSARQ